LRNVLVAWVVLVGLAAGSTGSMAAQSGNTGGGAATAPTAPAGQTPAQAAPEAETILTKAQQKDLLNDESQILAFVSKDTLLPIVSPVKCRFVSRESVAKELRKKFDEDKGTKRLERSELVLKKFGLMDRDFHLGPFLLSLLTEQIAGFYDNKTKQMNLLDWVPIDEQKPVMAHELTHALQDQKVGLTKWADQEIEGVAKNVGEDNRHIAKDEADTAREAVLEGQAMVSFADHMIADQGVTGKTLKDFPQLLQQMQATASDMSGSPVLARAPLVLQQALLFPYTTGLSFEQAVLVAKGTEAAFAGVLAAPPSSSFEILTPQSYLRHAPVPGMVLPDIHPLLSEAGFEPYDVGVMGELDVRMTAELFGGRPLAEALAPEWDGGIYYAAQRRTATPSEKDTTASLGLLYTSRWKNEDSARSFFEVFEQEMPREYNGLTRRKSDEKDENERVYTTREGDVLLTLEDKTVWVSEGFDLTLARKLRDAVDAANVSGHGPVMTAKAGIREQGLGVRAGDSELVGGLVQAIGEFGMMKAGLLR